MTGEIEVRMLYDGKCGERTVFLGRVAQIADAAAGLKSAVTEIKRHDGKNLRVEAYDPSGTLIYTAKVRSDA
jgi:hypothetical protein